MTVKGQLMSEETKAKISKAMKAKARRNKRIKNRIARRSRKATRTRRKNTALRRAEEVKAEVVTTNEEHEWLLAKFHSTLDELAAERNRNRQLLATLGQLAQVIALSQGGGT